MTILAPLAKTLPALPSGLRWSRTRDGYRIIGPSGEASRVEPGAGASWHHVWSTDGVRAHGTLERALRDAAQRAWALACA